MSTPRGRGARNARGGDAKPSSSKSRPGSSIHSTNRAASQRGHQGGAGIGTTQSPNPATRNNSSTRSTSRTNARTRKNEPASNPQSSRDGPFRGKKPSAGPARKHSIPADESWRNPESAHGAEYSQRMTEKYQQLKAQREQERRDAIRNGFLADPDRPTSLKNAITPVGTCQDMCPEFERVERIVQSMVDGCEKTTVSGLETRVPCEEFMIKRFRRSAAGYDEQLPSDIRPPLVLQKTLNYLLDEVVGGPEPLAAIHKFVWDRTRSIRNDFSIQQVSKVDDLRVAIDCFERIARFHLLALHQLSHPTRENGEFDHFQEREQLNNTLLSLMYYYDDSRHKLTAPNEAEFRAYCIVFEIQSQRPDLEDRAQRWPQPLLCDPRVDTALRLHAAAGNGRDAQGPLRPRNPFAIAQNNYLRFWDMVGSPRVSYLLACAAEIYFHFVRRNAIHAIYRAYRVGLRGKTEDLTLDYLTRALGFDTEDQVEAFVSEHGFAIREREDGQSHVDLSSVASKTLNDTNSGRRQIWNQRLVETKRHGRAYSDVINGRSVATCRDLCLLESGTSEDESFRGRDGGMAEEEEEDLFVQAPASSTDDNQHDSAKTQTNDTSATPSLASTLFSNSPQPTTSSFGTGLAVTSAKPNPFATTAAALKANPFQAASALGRTGETPQAPVNPFAKAAAALNANSQGTGALGTPSSSGTAASGPAAPSLFSTGSASSSIFATGSAPSSFPTIGGATSLLSTSSSPFGGLTSSAGPKTSPFATTNSSNPPAFPSFAPSSLAPSTSAPFGQVATPAPSESPKPLFQAFVEPAPDEADGQDSNQTGNQPTHGPVSSTPSATPAASLFQPSAPSNPFQEPKPLELGSLMSTPTIDNSSSVDKPPFPPPLQFPSQQTSTPKPAGSDKLMSGALSASPRAPTFDSATLDQPSTAKPTTSPFSSSSQPLDQQPAASSTSDSPEPASSNFVPSQRPPPFSSPPSTPAAIQNEVNSRFSISRTPDQSSHEERQKVISNLAREYVSEDYGILEQALEYLVGEVIFKDESKRVEREQELQRLYDAKLHVFGKRYFRKWKTLTWARYMAKRGNSFRQSMQKMQEDALRAQKEAESKARAAAAERDEIFEDWLQQTRSETAARKSSSPRATEAPKLPTEVKAPNGGSLQNPPREKEIKSVTRSLVNGHSTSKESSAQRKVNNIGHRHTQSQTMKPLPTPYAKEPPHRSSLDSSRPHHLDTVNPQQEPTHRKKHKGAMNKDASTNHRGSAGRNDDSRISRDTTRTDYFALKARGITLATPSWRRVTKRARGSDDHTYPQANPTKLARHASHEPNSHVSLNSRSTSSSSQAYDTDDLFKRVDALRNVLAEGEAWFREQRLLMEREDAKVAERKQMLRQTGRSEEWRPSPSRTSQRIQAGGGSELWGRAEKYYKAEMERRAAEKSGAPTESSTSTSPKINGIREKTRGGTASTNGPEEIDFDAEEDEVEEEDVRDGDYELMDEDEEDEELEDDFEGEEDEVHGVQDSQFHGMGTSADDAIEL